MNRLPGEILQIISVFLADAKNICHLSSTCKYFKSLELHKLISDIRRTSTNVNMIPASILPQITHLDYIMENLIGICELFPSVTSLTLWISNKIDDTPTCYAVRALPTPSKSTQLNIHNLHGRMRIGEYLVGCVNLIDLNLYMHQYTDGKSLVGKLSSSIKNITIDSSGSGGASDVISAIKQCDL
jgi:hypothetical protein